MQILWMRRAKAMNQYAGLDEQGLGIIKMVQRGFRVNLEARPSIRLEKSSITALDCMTMCLVEIEINHTIDTNMLKIRLN